MYYITKNAPPPYSQSFIKVLVKVKSLVPNQYPILNFEEGQEGILQHDKAQSRLAKVWDLEHLSINNLDK